MNPSSGLACSVLSSNVGQELLWFQATFSSLFGFLFCFPLVEIVKNRLTIITNQKRLLCLAYKLIRYIFFFFFFNTAQLTVELHPNVFWDVRILLVKRVQSPISSEYCFLHTNWSDFAQRSHALPFLLKRKRWTPNKKKQVCQQKQVVFKNEDDSAEFHW